MKLFAGRWHGDTNGTQTSPLCYLADLMTKPSMRIEKDTLGELEIPADVYYGIHTLRAAQNFPFSGQCIHRELIRAFALVKQACAATNAELGYLPAELARAIKTACTELAAGKLDKAILVDPFQGGAGTALNMNCNEIIANRSCELLGGKPGDVSLVHPLDHVNLHQSTNDVFPTALKLASLSLLIELEKHISHFQQQLQKKEIEFRDIVKVARTELTDAVPMTMGMTFAAFAEAISRDRWRIFKSRERIKKVNLGGTAIGTGIGAPRDYIFLVTGHLRDISGLPLSRAENMVDSTQNLDSFVEVSGMLKACAVNLMKISSDLRLLASGPDTGFGELSLPALQAGSSIMAGKINPVMPEAATQISLQVMGNDQTISLASSQGQLELNHLLPLIAYNILESITLLSGAVWGMAERCVGGITANKRRCLAHVEKSNALATVLVPALGYERVEQLVKDAGNSQNSLQEELVKQGIASREFIETLLSPKRLCKQGFTRDDPLMGG